MGPLCTVPLCHMISVFMYQTTNIWNLNCMLSFKKAKKNKTIN